MFNLRQLAPSMPTIRHASPPREDASAPGVLRRRVLATVHSEPEPIEAGLLRFARRVGFGRPVLASALAAAVLLLMAVAIGAHELTGSSMPPERTRVAAEVHGAHVSLRRVGSHGELRISDMPPPPVGEVYEVWLARTDARPQPTDALFTVTKAGRSSVEVPGSLRGVREVMVTAEPVGGSRHPTSPAVLSVLLKQPSSG